MEPSTVKVLGGSCVIVRMNLLTELGLFFLGGGYLMSSKGAP